MTSLPLAGGRRDMCGGRQKRKFRVRCSFVLLLVLLAMADPGITGFLSPLVVCPVYGYVHLGEDQTIFFRSDNDLMYFVVDLPNCVAFNVFELRVRDFKRENLLVEDTLGRKWSKMHYTYDYHHNVLKFMVTGNSSSILVVKTWNVPPKCKPVDQDLKFIFPSGVKVGKDCFNHQNAVFASTKGSAFRVNSNAAFFNRSSADHVELPRLPDFCFKSEKNVSYSSNHIDYSIHIAYIPVGLILFLMTVCICMCIGCSKKPIMQQVRANTVVRLPVESCTTSATPGKENPPPLASDSPPTYDDIEKADAPPPSYAEILKDYILPKETTTGSQQKTLVQIEMAVADSVKEPTDANTATPAEQESSSMKSEVTTAKSNNVKTQSSFRSLKEEK